VIIELKIAGLDRVWPSILRRTISTSTAGYVNLSESSTRESLAAVGAHPDEHGAAEPFQGSGDGSMTLVPHPFLCKSLATCRMENGALVRWLAALFPVLDQPYKVRWSSVVRSPSCADGIDGHLRNSFGAIRACALPLQGPRLHAVPRMDFECVGFQMAGHFSMFNSAAILSGFSSLVPFSFFARTGLLPAFGFVR